MMNKLCLEAAGLRIFFGPFPGLINAESTTSGDIIYGNPAQSVSVWTLYDPVEGCSVSMEDSAPGVRCRFSA